MATFVYANTDVIRARAERFRQSANDLGIYAEDFAETARLMTKQAIEGIYGPELGTNEKWTIAWAKSSKGSTLGSLTVVSVHPYVLGYEFGVRVENPYQIWARNAPDRPVDAGGGPPGTGSTFLRFYWAKRDKVFIGPVVNHSARAHHRMPYLIAFLHEIGRYGWSNAVKAAITNAPYDPAIPVGIPRIFEPVYNDEQTGR